MYTSVTKRYKRHRQLLKTGFVYLLISAFCVLFDKVYALYGHGVESAYMAFLYLYPLLGGALPFLLLWIFNSRVNLARHYRFFYNCYNSGIATLTVGSVLKGIFEIAGTSSPYVIVFAVCGWTMLAFGLIAFLLNWRRIRRAYHYA